MHAFNVVSALLFLLSPLALADDTTHVTSTSTATITKTLTNVIATETVTGAAPSTTASAATSIFYPSSNSTIAVAAPTTSAPAVQQPYLGAAVGPNTANLVVAGAVGVVVAVLGAGF
jgi:hypothetical protein